MGDPQLHYMFNSHYHYMCNNNTSPHTEPKFYSSLKYNNSVLLTCEAYNNFGLLFSSITPYRLHDKIITRCLLFVNFVTLLVVLEYKHEQLQYNRAIRLTSNLRSLANTVVCHQYKWVICGKPTTKCLNYWISQFLV